MSLRHIPDELHLRVRIAYAGSWEVLIDTHARQALEFVCEFAQRLPPLEGLELFFGVVAVPEAMQEVISNRTLVALDLESLPPLTRPQRLTGWERFRPDLLLENARVRRHYAERTVELARMVGARVAEAVISTHVENAVEFTGLLKGVMPVNAASDRYLIEFDLPDGIAQMVRQRVRARVAGAELIAQYDEPRPRHREPEPPAAPIPPLPVPMALPAPTGAAPAAAPSAEPAVAHDHGERPAVAASLPPEPLRLRILP
jgi:hypothetical protein